MSRRPTSCTASTIARAVACGRVDRHGGDHALYRTPAPACRGDQGDGLTGDLPIIAAFIILALYIYSSGLRAPELIAFIKDIMIYIVVLVALAVAPCKPGGYGAVFAAAADAFAAKGGQIMLLPEFYCSILILADFATSPQRTISAARILVKSSVELPTASMPIRLS
jgi:hypothetical protein